MRSAPTGRRPHFAGYPPAAMDELTAELGDRVKVLESDWNCGSTLIFNHQKKPFDDVRVRRALSLAIDRWGSAEAAALRKPRFPAPGSVSPG